MEPVGLAVGVVGLAGLFSVCLDAVQRFDAWKKFDDELAILGVRVEAERLRLDRWGQAVGFKQDSTSDVESHHHSVLDDARTFAMVAKLLKVLQQVFIKKGGVLFSASARSIDAGDDLAAQGPFGISPTSKRARFKWALKDKATCMVQIEQLEVLVQKLHDLVPPYEAQDGVHGAENADQEALNDLDGVLADREEFRAAILDIEQSLKAEARRELHLWLLGRHIPNEVFEKATKGRLEKTCQWMLSRQELLDWASSDFSDCSTKYLWIHGPPAFGKTVLCATLLQHIRAKFTTPVVSYFFSSEDLESRRDPYVAMRSWLVQLLPEATVFDLLRRRWESSHSQMALTGDVIGAFEEVVQTLSECTFVMDGLDECEQGDVTDDNSSVTNFLKTISRIVSCTNTRIMITSREETAIRQGLMNKAGVTTVEYRISQQDVRPDIDEYSRAVVRAKLIGRDEKTCENLCQKMAERCEGQFLWIKLKGSRLGRYKAAALLEAEIEKTPSGLDDLYGRNWDRIGAFEDPDDRERAYAMMRWVSFAARPLTVAELTAALLVDLSCENMQLNQVPYSIEDDYVENEILKMSASLLETHESLSAADGRDPSTRTVHFTHFTAKQYFVLRMAEKIDTLMVNERLRSSVQVACDNELASKCLHYISMPHVWKDIGQDVHPIYRSFRDYAADAWYEHAAASDHDEVVQRANNFFTEKDSVWKLWRDWFDLQRAVEGEPHQTVDEGPLGYATQFNLIETTRYLVESGHCNVNDKHLRSGFTALQRAIACGNLNMVLVLLSAGADIFLPGKGGLTALHAAAIIGQYKLVELFLNVGVNVNTPDDDIETALHIATRDENVDAIRMLLDRGADPLAVNLGGWTPFTIASASGKLEVIDMFLRTGIDVDTCSSDGPTSLLVASLLGHADAVRMLLDRGADRSAILERGITALHLASHYGHSKVVRNLLQGCSNGNAHGQQNMSPLFQAAVDGNVDTVKLLLKRGSDPLVVHGKGLTLTQVAARYGSLDVLQVLLDAGLDVETDKGLTPLLQACVGGHADVVQMLLARGANINAVYEGLGALHVAAFYGHLNIAEILLSKGLDLNTTIQVPFHIAAGQGSVDMVRFLLECGLKATSINRNGPWTPFHATVTRDHSLVAKLLVHGNASGVNARTDTGSTPAIFAAAGGHADILQMLLDYGADVSIANDSGHTPIHSSAELGDVETARLLIKQEAKYSILDENRFTAMCSNATSEGSVEIVQFLPHAKAILDAKDNNCWTPLMHACREGRTDMVKLLLDAGANLAMKDKAEGTALHLASMFGATEVVNVLLSGGADTGAIDAQGSTATLFAAAEGYTDVLQLLIDAGADMHAKDKNADTALHIAAYQGHKEIIQLLLQQVMDVDAVNSSGATALHNAAEKGHFQIFKLLLEHGANTEARNGLGSNPLMLAAGNGHTELVELCLGSGAVIDAADEWGNTPLTEASYWGYIDTVKLLLEMGADKEMTDNYGQAPLLLASYGGHVGVVSLLLDAEANKETKSQRGATPLSDASQRGHTHVVGLLLEKGANIHTRDVSGRTPLLLAAAHGHAEVVELLLDNRGSPEELDPDVGDRFGQKALSFAVRFREYAIVRMLLLTGRVHMLSDDEFGRTPVSWAKDLGCASMDDFFAGEDKVEEEQQPVSAGNEAAEMKHDGPQSCAGGEAGQPADEEGPYICDGCLSRIPRSMGSRACESCYAHPGRYILCDSCHGLGARCHDPEHSLTEMPGEACRQ